MTLYKTSAMGEAVLIWSFLFTSFSHHISSRALRDKLRVFELFYNSQVLKSFTYALNQVLMQSGGQGFYSMADSECIAALCEGASLPKTFDLVAEVLNWTTSEYCTRYEQMLDAHRIAGLSWKAEVRR